jgi:hypothetical protein
LSRRPKTERKEGRDDREVKAGGLPFKKGAFVQNVITHEICRSSGFFDRCGSGNTGISYPNP